MMPVYQMLAKMSLKVQCNDPNRSVLGCSLPLVFYWQETVGTGHQVA
jgi:hypothetical protein